MILHVHIRRVSDDVIRIFNWELEDKYIEEDHETGLIDYMWSDGNYACDCNRAWFFEQAIDKHAEDPDIQCSDGMYIVDKIVNDVGDVMYSEEGVM